MDALVFDVSEKCIIEYSSFPGYGVKEARVLETSRAYRAERTATENVEQIV